MSDVERLVWDTLDDAGRRVWLALMGLTSPWSNHGQHCAATTGQLRGRDGRAHRGEPPKYPERCDCWVRARVDRQTLAVLAALGEP